MYGERVPKSGRKHYEHIIPEILDVVRSQIDKYESALAERFNRYANMSFGEWIVKVNAMDAKEWSSNKRSEIICLVFE
jgi:AraC-like DNA-binding protein